MQISANGRFLSANGFHVAVDAHLLSGQDSYRSAGVHQYILHLLRHLAQADDRMRCTALLGPGGFPSDAAFNRMQAAGMDDIAGRPATEGCLRGWTTSLGIPVIRSLRSRWPTSRPPVRVLWEQVVQPWTLRQIGADLVHGPVFVGPLLAPCPVVVTIHDLSFLRFPDLFRPVNRLYLTMMTRLSARRARRLIAVSAHTADETTHLLGVPSRRIDVVYHGVDPDFRPLPADEVAAFRQERRPPERFALFVGTLEPRKNLVRLIEAFAHVRGGQTKLVLVGGKGWLYDEPFARVEALGLNEEIIFPGYVRSEELPLWYNAATILAYPSLYEGFGLPVLEAQACGTPVLTSSVSSLPEAAGDAALMVDPYDVEALAEGLNRLLTDAALQKELRERGLSHAGQFTWPRTARETACVYQRALATGSVLGADGTSTDRMSAAEGGGM